MKRCPECDNVLEILKKRPYHYTESGLDYIWLSGISQYKCRKCGEIYTEIPHVDELHLLIGKNIVCKKELLTGPEVRFLRKEIGMKSKDMAAALSMEPETYSRWENGKQVIAAPHDKNLRMLYVMNASETMGRVLSQNSRSILHDIAARKAPKKSKKVQFKPSEWLNTLNEPIFGVQTCNA
jgi:putative zinc finger/helix-turn-helix YgiT family protein